MSTSRASAAIPSVFMANHPTEIPSTFLQLIGPHGTVLATCAILYAGRKGATLSCFGKICCLPPRGRSNSGGGGGGGLLSDFVSI